MGSQADDVETLGCKIKGSKVEPFCNAVIVSGCLELPRLGSHLHWVTLDTKGKRARVVPWPCRCGATVLALIHYSTVCYMAEPSKTVIYILARDIQCARTETRT